MSKEILIVPTGSANLASVAAAFDKLGQKSRICKSKSEILQASHMVLPGVGSWKTAVDYLSTKGYFEPLVKRISRNLPTLCICLGFQLLCQMSEESPQFCGLSIIKKDIVRFENRIKTPQQGWNRVTASQRCNYVSNGWAYFSNSYILKVPPDGWNYASSIYGIPFISAVEKGNILGCQFHPELSGKFGLNILKRWINGAKTTPSCKYSIRIIPCLDTEHGLVVKGINFNNLRNLGNPEKLAHLYELEGADEIFILDISATIEKRNTAVETIKSVRKKISIPLSVGGGIKNAKQAASLLEAGADKICINTAAVERADLITELSSKFGRQCTVVAIDSRKTDTGFKVVTYSGKYITKIDVISWAKKAVEKGAGEILLTSWDRDGTRKGYDLELISRVSEAVSVPVIASGGASGPSDMLSAVKSGAQAVLAASVFHDKEYTITETKDFLKSNGVGVRL